MRVLIIEGELPARTALITVVRARPDVESIHCAGDAAETMGALHARSFDVILLDIRMPDLSGPELVECLRPRGGYAPAIIFITAHDEHAVIAFENHAMDYVLKPFSAGRVNEAVGLAIRRTPSERAARLLELLPQLRSIGTKSPKIAIKTKGRVLFLDPSEVTAVEAQGNYVLLQRQAGSHLLRESMTTMADKLSVYGFLRIHRSVLVNANCVQDIQPLNTGEFVLRIRGGKEYTVSRTYKTNLSALAPASSGVWSGANAAFAT